MARGFKKSSIIGGALDSDVLTQLKQRGVILDKRSGRTSKEISFLGSKTGWAKLSSSVDTFSRFVDEDGAAAPEYSSTLAARNVLFGGVLADKGKPKSGLPIDGRTNTSYRNSAYTGIRPMPGITNVSINSKNTFGTLRVATVEFNVWTLEEISLFEKLYMRPGYSVLLEWGHSMYVDNKGDIVSNIQTISNFFDGEYDGDKNKLQGYINRLKTESSNNYDAIFGYVKNFQWSYNIDGGYDCNCDIITFGEVIESIKVIVTPGMTSNDNPEPVTENEKQEVEVKENIKKVRTPIHNFLISLIEPEVGGNDYVGPSPTKTAEANAPELYKNFKRDLDGRFFDVQARKFKMSSKDSKGLFKYIKLRDLLILLNNSFMYGEKKDKRLIEFNTEEPRSLMYTFRNHSVLDLGICYNTKSNSGIPLVYVGQDKFSIDSPKTIEEYLNRQVDKNYKNFSQKRIDFEKNKIYEFIPEYDKHQSILNLYINVQFILDELEKILDSGEVNAKTLLNFVKNILKKLQENLGDINEFDLVYDEELFQYFVVDRELVPDKIESIINLTGLRSTLTNLSFSSKITPRLASMIAVSAQAGGTDVGLDTENMFRWNRGLKDRVVPRKVLNVDKPEAVNTDTLVTDIRSLNEYVKAFNQSYGTTGRNYNKEELKSLSTLHASIMRRLATIDSNTGKNGAKGIIPFELSLTLDGIGGVKIGQAFKVNKGILPTTYDDIIAFLVNRVNHNIQGNRWSTELTAQTIVIDPKPSSLEAIPADLTKAVVDESVADLPFTVSSDFTQRKLPSELAVSQDTINLIKRFEGFEEKAYPDPGSKGKPITIGYGTTRINGNPILEGQTITESEAEKLLRKDVNRFAESVRGLVKVKLTESEFGALVSFAYNAGPGNLGASTLLRYLNSERYIDASNQFLRWTKASGVQLKGLIKRRQAEKQLFLKGSPGDPK